MEPARVGRRAFIQKATLNHGQEIQFLRIRSLPFDTAGSVRSGH